MRHLIKLRALCVEILYYFSILHVIVGGSPVIVGPQEVTVQENTVVSLTCTYTSETNPWYLSWNRNGADLPYVDFATKPCAVLTNDLDATIRSQRYKITCNQTLSTYTTTLTIPAENVTEYEHKSSWTCSSFIDNKESNATTLFVIAPVKWVILTAPTHVFITPATSASLTCETSASRPSASVQWYINGSLVTSPRYNIVSNFSGSSTDGPRVVTISTIQIPWEDGGWNQTVHCRANNVNTVTSNTSTVVHVSPGIPTILKATNDSIFYEGITATLHCTQKGGNPTPRISWNGACANGNGVNIVSDALTVNFSRTMHHSLCYCITRTYGDVSRTTSISLTVFYPPSNVVIRDVPPFPWLEHETGTLYCSADAGYPSNTMYKWTSAPRKLMNNNVSLNFDQLTPNDHNKSYTCQAENNYTIVKNTIISKDVTLQVEYSPTISLDNSSIEVIEGRDIKRECHATGNPSPSVSWWYNNVQVQAASGTWAELAISNISRTQNGTYTCHATAQSKHGLFKAEKQIKIDIFYPPEVKVQIKLENTKASIQCLTQSHPENSTVVALVQTYKGTIIRQISNQQNSNLSHLTYQDMGIYTCNATNGIPNRRGNTFISSSGILKAEYAADFCSYTDDFVKFYLSLNTNNTIRIVFISTFNISISDISWMNKTSLMHSSDNIQFELGTTSTQCRMYNVNVELQAYVALMYLKNFNKHHVGNYTLYVKQEESKRFILIPSGPPEIPQNFAITEFNHNSFTLTWKKGSNGGCTQYFILEYLNVNRNNLQKINITETKAKQYTTAINNLQPSSFYQVKLYSQNGKGKTSSLIINVTTTEVASLDEENQQSLTFGEGIATGVGVCVSLLISGIVLVFVFWKKCSFKDATNHTAVSFERNIYQDASEANADIHIYTELGRQKQNELTLGEDNDARALPVGPLQAKDGVYHNLAIF